MESLLADINCCRLCEKHLPCSPRPLSQAHPQARILIIGQAPGIKAHDSATAWNDASGEQLRLWLNVSRTTFYDPRYFALMSMSFCYPGKGRSGDLSPRPECAPTWHPALLDAAQPLLATQQSLV